jgi:hypothetical protein
MKLNNIFVKDIAEVVAETLRTDNWIFLLIYLLNKGILKDL